MAGFCRSQTRKLLELQTGGRCEPAFFPDDLPRPFFAWDESFDVSAMTHSSERSSMLLVVLVVHSDLPSLFAKRVPTDLWTSKSAAPTQAGQGAPSSKPLSENHPSDHACLLYQAWTFDTPYSGRIKWGIRQPESCSRQVWQGPDEPRRPPDQIGTIGMGRGGGTSQRGMQWPRKSVSSTLRPFM